MSRYKLSGSLLAWLSVCKEGVADAFNFPLSLAYLKSKRVYPSGASLPRLSWKRGTFVILSVSVWVIWKVMDGFS